MVTIIKPVKTFQLDLPRIWLNKEILIALSLRDISLRYRYPLFGIFWAIFQPLLLTLIFSFIFRKSLNLENPNVPYIVFIFSGLIFWNFFVNTLTRISHSLNANRSLITKIYFPRLIIPLSVIATSILDFTFSFIVLIFMLLYFHLPISVQTFFSLIPSLLIALLTSLGLGLFFATLELKYNDTKRILPLLIQALFFLTPIFYHKNILGQEHQFLLFLNPISAVVYYYRSSAFLSQPLNYPEILLSVTCCLFITLFGLFYFKKNETEFADIL